MKAGTNLILYLACSLVLVIVLLEFPAYTMYTGEIFIVIFILGLILAFNTTVRQTQKIVREKPTEQAAHQ